MSGGGTGIIVFPVLLSFGFPYPLVLAMTNAASTFWVLPAARNYLKGRKIDWPFIIIFSLIGLIGSYFAVLLVVNINQRILGIVVGCIILTLVVYTFFKKELGVVEHKIYSKRRQAMSYPFALILGFYENFFGSGNGIIFTVLTSYTKGFDFIDALGYYYAIAFSWCLFGLVLLVSKGFYDINLMIVGILGSVIGGYIGSRYARYKGNKFIKMIFVIVGGVLGLKLLLGL